MVFTRKDFLGIASCLAFFVSAAVFFLAQKNGLFMGGGWDVVFVSVPFIGFILGVTGTVKSVKQKSVRIFSVTGMLLNVAPMGFSILMIAMSAAVMH